MCKVPQGYNYNNNVIVCLTFCGTGFREWVYIHSLADNPTECQAEARLYKAFHRIGWD